jgi:hypothetical protein
MENVMRKQERGKKSAHILSRGIIHSQARDARFLGLGSVDSGAEDEAGDETLARRCAG